MSSSSQPTTTVEPIQLITHIDFHVLFRDSLFNTLPTYFNLESTASEVLYFIESTTVPALFGSLPAIIGVEEEEDIAQDSVVVMGSVSDFMGGVLPGKILLNEIASTDINPDTAHVLYYSTSPGTIVTQMTRNELKVYGTSTMLVTRYNEPDSELLFISDGSYTSMLNDTFLAEMQRIIEPQGMGDDTLEGGSGEGEPSEEDDTLPASGWGMAIVDVPVMEAKNADSGEVFATNNKENVFSETTAELIDYITQIPLLAFNTLTENIYVAADGQTACGYLSLDFGSISSLTIGGEEFKALGSPSLIVFKHEKSTPSELIAMADLSGLDVQGKAGETISNFEVKLNFNWDILII